MGSEMCIRDSDPAAMHKQLLGQLFLDGPASLEVDYPCFPFVLVEIRSSFQICLIRQLLALNRAYAVRLHEHDSPIWFGNLPSAY